MAKKKVEKTRKQKVISNITSAIIIVILCILSYTLSNVFVAMPDKQSQLDEHFDDVHPARRLYWSYTDCDGHNHGVSIELGITAEEFNKSIHSDTMRKSTYLDPPGVHCLTPNDKYVLKIVEMINTITEGYSYKDRALVALYFVQTAIDYEYDIDNYGWDGFIAYPLETLYLGKGDCEDTSILLASIYLAMGYDVALLDFTEHVAVGVRWEGQNDYLFCETTADLKSDFRHTLCCDGEYPHIYYIDSIPSICNALNTGMATYRYWIERTFNI